MSDAYERLAGEVRALADEWDALAEISDHDRRYTLYNVAEKTRALVDASIARGLQEIAEGKAHRRDDLLGDAPNGYTNGHSEA